VLITDQVQIPLPVAQLGNLDKANFETTGFELKSEQVRLTKHPAGKNLAKTSFRENG
jgi:hypothetical protein